MNVKFNIPEYGVTQINKALKEVIEDNFSYVRVKGEYQKYERPQRSNLHYS